MELDQMRKLSPQQLTEEVAKKRQELTDLTQEMHTKEVKHVRKARAIKKDIARLLTIKHESVPTQGDKDA